MPSRHRCPFCLSRVGSEGSARHLWSSLSVDSQKGSYHCFRCHASGRLYESLAKKLGVTYNPALYIDDEDHHIELKPNDVTPLYPLSSALRSRTTKSYAEYLISRKVCDEAVKHFKIGVYHGAERWLVGSLVFPFADGNYSGAVYRRKDGQYATPGLPSHVLFNAGYLQQYEDVYIVEGVFDVICIYPARAVATFGKDVSEDRLDRLAKSKANLIITMDGDAWEFSQSLFYRLALRGKTARWGKLPAGYDPGDLGKAFTSCIDFA